MRPAALRRSSTKPTRVRCLVLAALLGPAAAAAQLTEEDAVQRALGRAEVRELAEGEVEVARGEAVRAGLWPNPGLSFSREETSGSPGGGRDDLWLLSQGFDLSGKRGLRADAAGRRVEAARARGDFTRLVLEAEVRGRFHELLAAERRVAAAAEALRRIEALATAVERRLAAGDASGYDRGRLELERAGIAARAAVEEAAAARARARLGGLLGAPGDAPAVRGELLPDGGPPVLDALAGRVPARPDLRSLAEEAEAGALDSRAGGRGWIPELTLSAGYRSTTAQGARRDGFALGLSLPFPLLDRSQDEAQRGRGRARAARARLALETSAASAEVRGLHAEASALGAAARHFRRSALDTSRRLVATADAAYRGGELGILELVDAHRGALEAELQSVELELAARRARIDLDRATGGTTP